MIRILRLVVVLAALLMAAPSVVYLRTSVEPGWALNKDFGQEYLLARAVADGVNPYLPIRDLAERYLEPVGLLDKAIPTPHPPSAGVLFLPFLLFDYSTAADLWFGVQVVCLLVAAALVLRTGRLPVKPAWVPIIAFALLGWRPVLVDLAIGQVTVVILALLATSELLLQHNRNRLAGIVLGVSLLLKPVAWPWLLILLWRRNWSAVLAGVAVGLVGFMLPAVTIGYGPVFDYVTRVLPSVSAWYANEPTNISLWTVGPHLFGLTQFGRAVGAAIPLVILAIALGWLRMRPPLDVAMGMATCLSILVNPISWQYNLVLVLLPLAALVNQLRRLRLPRVPLALTLLVAAALGVPTDAWPAALISSALVCALGALLVWSSRGAELDSLAAQDDVAHPGAVLAAVP